VAYHGDVSESPEPADEIDLRDYARRVAARWWIVAICIAVAVAASYAFTITEDRRLTRGAAIVYLGQPVSPNGSPIANALSTNPLFAQSYARQSAVRDAAAQTAGLKAGALDGRVSVEFVSAECRRRQRPGGCGGPRSQSLHGRQGRARDRRA
jgi:hypothetical protein